MAKLRTKQQLFVQHYLACWNASEAARRAGYSPKTAGAIGYENLKKPEIQVAIREGIAAIMPAGEVIQRLADHARGTLDDFLTIGEEDVITEHRSHMADGSIIVSIETTKRPIARLDMKKAAAAGKLHLVKACHLTDKGVRIELYDAQAALGLLGKHHNLFREQATTLNITPEELAEMTDEELDELARKRGLL